MIRWQILLNPKDYAAEIAAHPPVGAATLLLVLLTELIVISVIGGGDAFVQRNYDREFRWNLGIALLIRPLLALTLCLTLTFFTFGIARGGGHPLSFEAVFCLLVIAIVPKFVIWLTYPLREVSRTTLYVWRALSPVFLIYATLRLWTAFTTATALHGWQALLMLAPFLIALCAVSLFEIFEKSDSLCTGYLWQRAFGKRVVVYYPRGSVAAEVKEIVAEADATVAQIEHLLDVKPVPFRILIFLCLNEEELRRLTKVEGRLGGGYAGIDRISLVHGPWRDIKATVAHELTHVVANQCLKRYLMPLLNEGLAVYGEAHIVPVSAHAAIQIPLSLGTLAHAGVFYEWCYVTELDYAPRDIYMHAAALVDYLVTRYGMEKFKDLCRMTAYDSRQHKFAQLHKAAVAVYGLSLRQLEQNWRQEWIALGQIQVAQDLPDSTSS